ncbi:MAG: hypothetical protein ACLQKH_18015 [Steroidobacteraceae bacterium]
MALTILGYVNSSGTPIQWDSVAFGGVEQIDQQKNATLGVDYAPVFPLPYPFARETDLSTMPAVLRRGTCFRCSYAEWLMLRNAGCLATQ